MWIMNTVFVFTIVCISSESPDLSGENQKDSILFCDAQKQGCDDLGQAAALIVEWAFENVRAQEPKAGDAQRMKA